MTDPLILTGQTQSHLIHHNGQLIHPQIKTDFQALQNAAQKAGFELAIASGFRDFERQKTIWDQKFLGIRPMLDDANQRIDVNQLTEDEIVHAILRWSALPGASRHHWGTDLDVFAKNTLAKNESLKLEPWEYLSGHQADFFSWLKQNIAKFGFFLPYPKNNDNTKRGIAFEPWHISHQASASTLQANLTQDVLQKVIKATDIKGKKAILAQLDSIYSHYVAIN